MMHHNRTRICGYLLTVGFAAAYLTFAVLSLLEAPLLLLELLVLSAIPFLLVTLMRRLFSVKRPYQDGTTPPPRRGTDDSFPSRHAYSAFFIATVAFRFASLASYILLPFAILLSVIRVALNLHYPRDVVAGAFLGVIAGIITLIFL